jgi:hypothetical protein
LMVGSIIFHNILGNSRMVFSAIVHITDEGGETKKFVRAEMWKFQIR